ncbi:hypothetical protein PENTCL1PPCAC_15254, partial [Pristionchus entomophagus]
QNNIFQREIGRMCSASTGNCYRVVDSVDPEVSISMVHRQLFTGEDENPETEVILIPPSESDKFDSSDTRFWSVAHRRITTGYASVVLCLPFVMGPIPLVEAETRQRSPYQVLTIGLGGGTLDMFWASMQRSMNITVVELDEAVVKVAERWFGVREVSTQVREYGNERRTIIGDGVEYVKKEKQRGVLYDVIVIDACDVDARRPCPVGKFLTEEMMGALSSITTHEGIAIFNVLPEGKFSEENNDIVNEVKT